MTPETPKPATPDQPKAAEAPIKKGTELLKRLETTSDKRDSDKVGVDVRRQDD
jgi:hypothetical protein